MPVSARTAAAWAASSCAPVARPSFASDRARSRFALRFVERGARLAHGRSGFDVELRIVVLGGKPSCARACAERGLGLLDAQAIVGGLDLRDRLVLLDRGADVDQKRSQPPRHLHRHRHLFVRGERSRDPHGLVELALGNADELHVAGLTGPAARRRCRSATFRLCRRLAFARR